MISSPFLRHRISFGCAAFGWAVMLTLSTTGCGPPRVPPPKLVSVKGVVVFKNGTPVAGGTVEFRSKSDPALTMMSVIGEDGAFELFTIFRNEKLSGATEGLCQVTVHPPPKELMKPVDPYRIAEPITIGPGENVFKIEVDPSHRRP